MNISYPYKLMHKDEISNHYIVLNQITNDVCLLKIYKTYDLETFTRIKNINSKHIAKIYDLMEDNKELFVFEEYIQGNTLENYLKRELSNSQRKDLFEQLCDGLTILHNSKPAIIHRDLKPENIMVTSDGTLKIIDFNAAKTYKNYQNSDTVLLGTYAYAAPEQYGYLQSDPRTDIFSVGKMLTLFFPDKSMDRIIRKATAIDPENRYRSINDLLYDVTGIFKRGGFSLKALVPPGFRRGKPLCMIISVLYLAIAVTFMLTYKSRVPMVKHWSVARHGYYDIFNVIMLYLPVDLAFDWTGLWNFLPMLKTNNRLQRYAFAAIYYLAFCLIYRTFNLYLVDLIFPYV